eukprot:4144831-Amphidinium_carterae.2
MIKNLILFETRGGLYHGLWIGVGFANLFWVLFLGLLGSAPFDDSADFACVRACLAILARWTATQSKCLARKPKDENVTHQLAIYAQHKS